MQTIRLRISDKIYRQFMWFLQRFSSEEVQVIKENDEFLSVQNYLKKELEQIDKGTADFSGIDQLEEKLEATIRKHEASNI